MKKLTFSLLLVGLMALFGGCTNKKDANKALGAMGFTDIQVTGYNFWSCGQDDTYHTGFRAKNPQGYYVEGTVCSGLIIKDATVRF
jgi:hypothetical protein